MNRAPRPEPTASGAGSRAPQQAGTAAPAGPLSVIVIGSAAAGMAAAAKLAKAGHSVTVIERSPEIGGDLRALERAGCRFDASPPLMALPAVLRDLFRKSGRPLERYVDLDVPPVARLHVFADGSRLEYVTGSRARQGAAMSEGLGPDAAASWTAFVDSLADTWQAARVAIAAPDPAVAWAERSTRRALASRRSLARLVGRQLSDPRLRALATWQVSLAGVAPRRAPAWVAAGAYVERTLGLWLPSDGPGALAGALIDRLGERRVTVLAPTTATGLRRHGHTVTGVHLDDGRTLEADLVLDSTGTAWAGERATRRAPARTAAPTRTTVLLRGDAPACAPEIVVHSPAGNTVWAWATGDAPDGHRAWTLRHRESADAAIATLVGAGLVNADEVLEFASDPAPAAPHPWAGGYRGFVAAARHRDAHPGLTRIGPAAFPGPATHLAVWGAALAAERLGPVPHAGRPGAG